MSFCSNCGHSLKLADKFCPNCGKTTQAPVGTGKSVPLYFIISVILVAGLLVVTYLLPIRSADRKYNGPILPGADTAPAVMSNRVEADGKLNFHSDTYVIVTGSYEQMDNVRSEMRRLQEYGLIAGYFWRPDFPSLEGKPLYSTFVGFFDNYGDCESKLRSLQQGHPDYYGLKLSRGTERVKIR